MNAFTCHVCGLKADIRNMCVKWGYDAEAGKAGGFMITHDPGPCSGDHENTGFYNRKLPLEYVFKHMPEFIFYINRLGINKKELKRTVDEIEKGRSYIRRFNVVKKEVKKLIIRLEGAGSLNGM